MTFNDVKDGLKALNYEDEHGVVDPIMSVVNQDSIEKFQNLLLTTQKAKMLGSKLVVEEVPPSNYSSCWLYNFVQETASRPIKPMIEDQEHYNSLMSKVNKEFQLGAPLTKRRHLIKNQEELKSLFN